MPLVYQAYYGTLDIVAPNNADWSSGPMLFQQPVGTILNLTGATEQMQIRKAWTDALPIVDFGNTPGTTLSNGGAAGTVTATATKALFLTIAPGIYVWDLLITLGGITTNWLAGTFTFAPGVSR